MTAAPSTPTPRPQAEAARDAAGPAARSQLTGWHVLAGFLTVFGLVGVVNAVFVYQALATFNGVTSEDAYRKGLAYNATLSAAAAQERLGWQTELSVSGDGRRLRVRLTDAAGQPVGGLALTGMLDRPATDRFARPLAFRQSGAGSYEAELGEPGPGGWVASLAGSKAGGEVVYRWKERIWLKPAS